MRGQWWRAAGRPRFARVLVVITVLTQLVAVAYEPARSPIFGVSLLLLDPIAAIYAWRASRRGHSPVVWRLAAIGRAFSFISTIAFAADVLSDRQIWWWLAVASGLLMFVSLTAAALAISTQRLARNQRWAFIAEVGTVLTSGLTVIWCFSLDPALQKQASALSFYEIGYPIANLLLLSAVVAVLIRGAVARLAQPLTVLLAGMLMYAVADAAFAASRVQGTETATSPLFSALLVFASLLMCVAAMQQNTLAPGAEPAAPTRMPAWSAHLPYLAVGAGNVLLVVFTIQQDAFLIWGGLAIGQTAMTVALAARQIISVRASNRLTVVDALTGLANISGLRDALDRSLRRRSGTGLLLIDLDGFKLVNDGYGHAVGDRILVEFARLVGAEVRRGDTPARVGGDEFVVLLDGVADEAQVIAVAERILAGLAANPVEADGDQITIRASIGLALAQPDESAQELQRRADLAMYESKRSGSHGWRKYEPSMTDRRAREALIGDKLLPSLAAGHFEVYYQPIVDMATGQVRAVEALLRWNHPVLGPVSPMEFIPVAERTGAILDIGLWTLREACAQTQQWRAAGRADLHVNVNVAARQLQEASFLTEVLGVLERTGLPAERLSLEITESAVVDEEVAIPTMNGLRDQGIRLAVDDFGTGYSSLHYLARLPVDILKIDRSFVAELDSTTRGAAVAEAVIRLGQVLGLAVVAEGVETAAQAAELQMLGCSVAQGYLFYRPMTAARLTAEVIEPAGAGARHGLRPTTP
ncbi:MAG: bifunctional diguanylate cyclase/phosphodiesterase [Actinoplanes sp.]